MQCPLHCQITCLYLSLECQTFEPSLVPHSPHAIWIAHLTDIRPYDDEKDRELAFLGDDETFEGYSWEFDKIIPIVPVPIKGQQNLFNAPIEPDDLEPIEL